ncbi:MAG: ABC transporter ATP-binding protein [Plectolyngbya sp. WJT66-NPBG17]|jgi:lipopolysaccharide transport system ATP-binding protein|nr:ABC transporter ATP-binding protein [Plectolyngbya sp. WJT66-NPBG17]
MSSPIIRVENLSKKYILSHQQEKATTFRDVLTQKFSHPFRRSASKVKEREEFWALKDVSFDVQQGDRVGIIGRNGAGKSTLLKILSRITAPTQGEIRIKGRVASLLEVGTGFHPELSGRENIFLNGAILGMSKAEIKHKFDEIVAFAEVEKFTDTPVKRYSSGMYVRLAFAVAAHLEPEVLVVDEVLAVGDSQFQKKCLGKMEDVAKEGRTVLFVSHNLTAISRLCESAILLSSGSLIQSGQTRDVLKHYQLLISDTVASTKGKQTFIVKNDQIRVDYVEITPNPAPVLNSLEITAIFLASETINEEFSVFICFTDYEKNYHGSLFSRDEALYFGFDSNGKMRVRCRLEFHTLLPGNFRLEVGLFSKQGECKIWVETGYEIEVTGELFNGSGFDGRGGYATHRGNWD